MWAHTLRKKVWRLALACEALHALVSPADPCRPCWCCLNTSYARSTVQKDDWMATQASPAPWASLLEPSWVTQSRLSDVTLLYFLQSISKYRYTSRILCFSPSPPNKIQSESHDFFWFFSAYKSYVYTTRYSMTHGIALCLRKSTYLSKKKITLLLKIENHHWSLWQVITLTKITDHRSS